MRFLLATLAAPLASFGGAAANETRKDAGGGPLRSSIVGLLSACLGFDRTAAAEMSELSRRVGILVRMDRPGDAAVDYHTTQVASESAEKRWAKAHGTERPTRRTYLMAGKAGGKSLQTSISQREYRSDVLLTLVLWERGGTPESPLLDQISDALRNPVFLPTLGRKACHLSLPMNPRIVEADDAIDAMRGDPFDSERIDSGARAAATGHVKRDESWFIGQALIRGNVRAVQGAACHADMDVPLRHKPTGTVYAYRRDEPRDRLAWLFSERREVSFPMPRREVA